MVALIAGLLAHPIHSTSGTLEAGPNGTSGRLVVRAFVDDFPPGRDSSAAVGYLAGRLTLTAPGGRRLPLVLVRVAEASGVVSLEITIPNPGPWQGVLIHNQLMCERFNDQINLIQVKQSGRTSTLLFSPGSPAQPIR